MMNMVFYMSTKSIAVYKIIDAFFLSKIEKEKDIDRNSSTAIQTPSTTVLNILHNREIFLTMVQLQICFLDHGGYFSTLSLYNAYFCSSLQKGDMHWYCSSNIGIAIVMQNLTHKLSQYTVFYVLTNTLVNEQDQT